MKTIRAKPSVSPFLSHLEELKAFRDNNVVAYLDVAAPRQGVRHLFAADAGWSEVRWGDDQSLQLTLISLRTAAPIPRTWTQTNQSTWVVPMNEITALAEWLEIEWASFRGNTDMNLRMWTE